MENDEDKILWLLSQNGACDRMDSKRSFSCAECPIYNKCSTKGRSDTSQETVTKCNTWLQNHKYVQPPVSENTNVTSPPVGVKFDDNKPRYDLVPFREWEEVVKVLSLGAKKYSPDNWKFVPESKSRYIAAAFRHLVARCMGEINDLETGLPHTAHCICCLLFLSWHDKEKPE